MKINIDSKDIANELYPNCKNDYPQLIQLFKGHILLIEPDHPVGEDVVYVDGKFKGYASDWINCLNFAEEFKIEYKDADELHLRVDAYQCEYELMF